MYGKSASGALQELNLINGRYKNASVVPVANGVAQKLVVPVVVDFLCVAI